MTHSRSVTARSSNHGKSLHLMSRLQKAQRDCGLRCASSWQTPFKRQVRWRSTLPRIWEALKLFQSWSTGRGLSASPTHYVARGPQRQTLRFSRSGDPAIEALYRTHWVSQELSEKKRERLAEKASRAPDLVVVQPLKSEWTCHRCGGTGALLMMENSGPACLCCVGLDDLEFLPAGEALLSRRVKAKSSRCAVVVRFSRSR